MTAVRSVAYSGDSPPAGFPRVTMNGTGDVTITWATSYADDYGVTGIVDIKHVSASAIGSTPLFAPCEILDPNGDGFHEAVRVRIFDDGPNPVANPKFTLFVGT